MRSLARFALVALAVLGAAGCHDEQIGKPVPEVLRIDDAWMRPTLPLDAGSMSTGAVYLTVLNGPDADTLLSASADGAARIEFHESWDDGGMMRMRRLDAIPMAAGAVTRLEPGGMHLMLVGLARDLSEGDTLAAALLFRSAGRVDVAVPVVMR